MLRHRPMLTLCVALIASVLIIRLTWGWHAGRLLRAELDSIRQRGEPAALSDMRFDPLPDGENAWVLQSQAMALAMNSGVDSPASGYGEYRNYPPFSDAWIRTATRSAQTPAHIEAFALARQARQRQRGQSLTAMPSSVFQLSLDRLGQGRQLSNLLADDALFQQINGREEAALQRSMDVLHLADTIYAEPMAVSYLVAGGYAALAYQRLQVIAPGIGTDDLASGTALRRQVIELIAYLLDERYLADSFQRAMEGERVLAMATVDEMAGGTWLIRPLATLSQVRDLHRARYMIDAADAPNAPAAARIFAAQPPPDGIGAPMPWSTPTTAIIPRYSRWFSPIVGDEFPHVRTVHFRHLGERRMTALALAIQLYRADHGGWPASLDVLVPPYIAALPADPFRDDGGPIGYEIRSTADGLPRPMLYLDCGDAEDTIRPEPMFGWQSDTRLSEGRREHIRQWRDVSRWTPAKLRKEYWPSAPSAQAIDGDPTEADRPGEQAEADEGGEDPGEQ